MSDTPKTDSMMRTADFMKPGAVVIPVEHARSIERELADVNARFAAFRLTASTDEEIRLRAELTSSQSTVEQLQGRVARLTEALIEARDDLESWGAYASEYFQHKHDLDGDISRINKVLSDSPSNWLQERLKGERERCAKVCDDMSDPYDGRDVCAAARAIRDLPEE